MATTKQIAFLDLHRDLLAGPVLVIGSKLYDYDAADPRDLFTRLDVGPVVGTDLEDGPGVDIVGDILDPPAELLAAAPFRTVVCMEMLTHVPDPFAVGRMIDRLLAPGGTVVLSECIVRKLSHMPHDHWRFTYSGLKLLLPGYHFDDERGRMALVRDRGDALLPLGDLPQVLHDRHPDETHLGFLARRLHRKVLAGGIFRLSRLLPETTTLVIGTKPEPAAEAGA